MADPASRRRPDHGQSATFSTRPWEVLKKHRWQLMAAGMLVVVWIVFLAAMAIYN